MMNDIAFDDLYPKYIKDLSQTHWTPLDIAKKAAEYLSEPNSRILDIGSGVGKFCITAGLQHPQSQFYGIEQRHDLFQFSELTKYKMNLANVQFMHRITLSIKSLSL